MIIPDATQDARFAGNPLVTGDPHIRFYAGMSLMSEGGYALGSLCVIDTVPRLLTTEQEAALRTLARQVINQLELARRIAAQDRLIAEREQAEEGQRLLGAAVASAVDGIIIADAYQRDMPILYANAAFLSLTGYAKEEVLGRNCRFLQGADTDLTAVRQIHDSLHAGHGCRVTLLNYRKDGSTFWNELTIAPILNAAGALTHFVGIQHDITALKEADAAIRQSEARLRFALESGRLGSYEINQVTGHFVAVSDTYKAHFGLPPEAEFSLRALIGMIHPDDRAHMQAVVARASEEHRGFQAEHRLIWPDGTIHWISAHGSPLYDASGNKPHLIGVTQDVTERKGAEEAQLRLVAIINSSDDAIIGKTITGIITSWNPGAEKVFGYTAAEMIGQPMLKLFPRERVDEEADFLTRIGRGEIIRHFDTVRVRKDGTRIDISVTLSPISNADGKVIGASKIARDITPRKQAETALQESELRLQLALESGRLGVWRRDMVTGEFLDISDIGKANFGLPPEADLCQADFFQAIHADDLASVQEAIHRTVTTGQLYQVEYRIIWPDGSVHWISANGTPVYNKTGEASYLIGITQEITSRKQLEAEREGMLQEALERADHDPLTGLLNHRVFHHRLNAETARAQRENTVLAVVMLDIDNFKFFNDVYGHAVGDRVLRLVAGKLHTICRSYDTLARFGGDEFALLLPHVGHATVGEIEARLRADLEGLFYRTDEGQSLIPVSVSLGVAHCLGAGTDCHGVLRQADERLLWSKTGGGAEETARLIRTDESNRVQGFSMLDALVTAVDNKDRYTRKHSEDVMTYSLMIARAMGMDEREQHTVAVAALLHDVGKIGVPDSILRKPGKLTDAEFDAVKQHPMMGAVMVGAVPGLEDTLDAVRHHHERWDGDGYPFGLQGEDTPLTARLMAVADAFSAMTTDRPYRKGMDRQKALHILAEGSGIQWDPECVRAFLAALGRTDRSISLPVQAA